MTVEAPERRGTTVVADRAVQRIAEQVISGMEGVGGSARRVLGVALGTGDPEQPANVTARVRDGRVSLAVELSVGYPAPIARTTRAARERLVRKVGELTGLVVERVDITVTALHSDRSRERSVA
ncbi:Asp23/Gls24 family envelope stress response protein [Amycolatopsis thermalba]|uniref:Asp23/Gls24 family envelope stress response protein n=1 Tax=Amycolatopsis thermalba TaxID=944492 RepID=A0ABY4NY06_9PSEU|nr:MULTISPECIES: Asp23/Gls24 family envelope stress response protein [Amycolatopsis]UQS24933.1 Asp23/Gls24 family envelope stress response protein [Amycolatopsis thermalba]